MANLAATDLGPVFQAAAREWNVDPALLQAVAGQESGGTVNPDQARSTAGAQGRMQIMPGTAQGLGVTDTSDPVQSIYGGAKYLSQMLDRYQDQPNPVHLALSAYNAGPGRVDDFLAGKTGLPAETVNYVPSIARRYQALTAGQQPSPMPPASIVDDVATANLNARMAQLRTGGGQSAPPTAAPTATPDFSGSDPFTVATRTAQALTAANSNAPGATPPSTSSSPPPSGPVSNAASGGGSPDYFAQAAAAAQRAAAPPPSAPTIRPTSVHAPPAGPQAGTGVMGAAANFAEGAGHAVLGASHALYSGIDYLNHTLPGGSFTAGGLIDAPTALANLDAQNRQYQASGVGSTLAGQAGDLAGQSVLTLPALGPLGAAGAAVGRGVAAGADAVSPVLGQGVRALNSVVAGTASVPGSPMLNAVVRPTSLAANGAAQGATVNLLTGDPDVGMGHNALTGAAMGGAFGVLAPAAAAGASRLYEGGASLVRPFTATGRATIADNALVNLGRDGPLAIDNSTLVPGSTPTLAQATGNAGIASVERAVASRYPNLFTERAAASNDARTGMVNNLTGTSTDITAAEAARDASAVPAITSPLAAATAPADASPVVGTIDQILASPAGQRDAVTSALGNIRSKLVTPVPFNDRVGTALDSVTGAINTGNVDPGLWAAREALVAARNGGAEQASTLARLQGTTSSDPAAQAIIDQATSTIATPHNVQSDPNQLYGIRKAINDSLSPLAARSGSDAQLAASELQQVKAALDNAIEGAAPGFKAGLAEYADSSRPIDAMRYLQSKGFTSADGTVTLAKVRGVLDDIGKQQALPGPRDAKSVPQTTVDSLQAVYADLLRQNNSRLGMQAGSNTFQNLATNSALSGLGAPLAWGATALNRVPVVGNMLTGGIANAYRGQNEAVQTALVNRLLHPELAAPAFAQAGRPRNLSGVSPLVIAPATIAGNRLLDGR